MHHINTKVLVGLGSAALITTLAAVLLVSHRQPAGENALGGEYALPELSRQLNDVQSISLKVAEDKTAVTLVKNDQGWVVKEKDAYPADTGKLRELLLKLADARLLEQKTANPERYATLGVTDIQAKDAKGVLIIPEGLKPPRQLIVGDFNSAGNGTFVRRSDERQSWLVKGNLSVERDPANWLDKTLVDIPTARIAEVIVTKPGNKPMRLFKNQPTDEKFQLADLPQGRELQSDTSLYEIASALSGYTLSDVASAQRIPLAEESKLLTARYVTFEGLTLDLKAWRQDDKHYAQMIAGLDQAIFDMRVQADQAKVKSEYEAKLKPSPEDSAKPAENPAKTQPEAPPLAVSDPAKDRQQRLDQLKSEADSLNRRFNGWSFIIAPYKYTNLEKSMDDLLKPVV